jgi:haloalkane dehalogenase
MYGNGITTNMMLKALFKTGLLNNNIMSKSDIEGYKKPMIEGKVKAMYHFFTNTCNNLPDYSDVIKNLNMPKLLIWGKYDDFLVFDNMKEKVISNLKLKEEHVHFIQAKHFIQEEQPNEINKLILSFLKN